MHRVIFIGVFGLLLALPGVQTIFRIVPEVRLYGAAALPPPPTWTLRGVWSGDFQRGAEAWFDAHIGFRGQALRTDSQIGYTLFREAWSRGSDHPVLGRQGTVFGQPYIDAYNGRLATSDAVLAERVALVGRLQRRLAERGIVLVVALAPGKPAIYPEWLDPRFVVPPAARGVGDRDRMLPMLRDHAIPVVDGQALFLRWKAASGDPLFPPQGIHWNRLGAARFVDAVWQEMAVQMRRSLPRLTVTATQRVARPNSGDAEQDIARLMNVWQFAPAGIPHVQAAFAVEAPPDGFRPRVVVVGDSFSDLMYDVIVREGMADTVEQFYYFTRWRRHPNRPPEVVDPATMDWMHDICSAHAVVLEINDGQVSQLGYSFVEAALARIPEVAQ